MSEREEIRNLLFLRLLPGVGDRRSARALRRFGSATEIVGLPDAEFSEALGHPAQDARAGETGRSRADAILERCDATEIRVVGLGLNGYPDRLLALADPPPVLFTRGSPGLFDRPSVALVGSRRATAPGRRTAERLARGLSEAGVAVVSGMALGIDGAAHRGALEGRGSTIAVLGSGPDRAYPSSHRRLFGSILERGLVVSEFPPGEKAHPYHFPRRNRVLAGLSSAVVVVQAARKSGALITVDHALDLGLEVFAVPGCVERRQAEGTNALLRDGAHVITRARDLLEVMGWEPNPGSNGGRRSTSATSTAPTSGAAPPTSDRSRVRSVLARSPRTVDSLVTELGIPVGRVLAALTRLELEGAACRVGGGWTCRAGR